MTTRQMPQESITSIRFVYNVLFYNMSYIDDDDDDDDDVCELFDQPF